MSDMFQPVVTDPSETEANNEGLANEAHDKLKHVGHWFVSNIGSCGVDRDELCNNYNAKPGSVPSNMLH